MKVKKLKEMLEEYIEILECFNEEVEISLRCNTYGINGDYLYIDGYRECGYIDLSKLAEDLEENAMRAGLDDAEDDE